MEPSTAGPVVESDDTTPTLGQEAVHKAAVVSKTGGDPAEKLSQKEQMSALDWLISDDPDVGRLGTRTLRLNVRDEDNPLWIEWTVRAIDGDELRRIGQDQNTNRAQRRARQGTQDDLDFHCRVIATATVDPPIREAMEKVGGVPNPARFIRDRFGHKPGLIPQISAEIMTLSGFDDSHVEEVDAGKP